MGLTKEELLKILENYNDDALICIKTWSSEVKHKVRVVEKNGHIVIVED